MKIRGERECTACGTRWSYYETGSVGCPACGSLRSVGRDERSRHTDLPATLDLSGVHADIDEASISVVAERVVEPCRAYLRRRGFISGGELLPLDDRYLAAVELRHAADVLARTRSPTDREQLYFLELLQGAEAGDRPDAASVPKPLWAVRGLAVTDAVRTYRGDVQTWCDDHEGTDRPADRRLIEALGDHLTRIRLLDGDVDPQTAEALVETIRDLHRGLTERDDEASQRARERFEELDDRR